MADRGDRVHARAAYDARDWRAARDAYAAVPADALDAADLRRYAESEWWLGGIDSCIRVLESAVARHPGDAEEAAELALLIALIRITRGDVTVGTAWIRRAGRILAQHPRSVQRAYLVYSEASMGLDGTGEAWSREAVDRARGVAEQVASPETEALSLVVAGMHTLRAGRISDAFAQIDDAMLHVVAGAIPPIWAGDILCTTIHACDEVVDFRRMEEWTRATEEWSAAHGSPPVYAGVCRIHRLELQSAAGDWPRVESELESACDELAGTDAWIAGAGWYQLGELRRLRGDRVGARVAYAQARTCGLDPLPGEALLDLREGRADRAWRLLENSLAHADALRRARLLRAAVQVALAIGRRAEAGALLAELEASASRFGSDGLRGWADHTRALVALADGDAAAAVAAAADALELFRRVGRRWEQAHVLVALASAFDLSSEPDAAANARTRAEEILRDLGAAPIVAARRAADDDPLTPREREVVALLAEGLANRAIAQELFISEKTVGRHLANVYIKLGVSTRTATVAWWHARDRGG